LSEIVIFEPLSHHQLKEIVNIQMKCVTDRLASKGISLVLREAALDVILSESYNPVSNVSSFETIILCGSPFIRRIINILLVSFGNNQPHTLCLAQVYGARPLKRWVEKHIITTISKMMVSEEAGEGSTVSIDAADDGKGLKYQVV
jgi:ATP-dependent Clp protease ATP-binding subunit ClpB